MNAGHHRRLVVLKLRIVRQILRKMPDQTCDGGHADKKHDGSRGEQETQEPHQQAHYFSVRSSLRAGRPTLSKGVPLPTASRSSAILPYATVSYADSARPLRQSYSAGAVA